MQHSKSPEPSQGSPGEPPLRQANLERALGPLCAYLYLTGPPSTRATIELEMRPQRPRAEALRLAWRADPCGLSGLRARAWAQCQERALGFVKTSQAPVEVQRSGLQGHTVLHAELFLSLLFQSALPPSLRCGQPERTHERYYVELPQMPADLDTAAALVLSEVSLPQHLLTAAQQRISHAMTQENPSVWEDTTAWFGPHCPAVLGRALSAGAKLGLQAHPACIQSLLSAPGWARGVHYPDPVVASALVAQGLRDQGQPHSALESLLSHAPCEDWSALALAKAALTAPGCPRRRERLLVGLLRSQLWSGGWPGGPWFMVPYPQDQMGVFSSDAATSAYALRALEALRVGPLEDLRGAARP